MPDALLPPQTRVLVVTPDKAGHAVVCNGVATALGGLLQAFEAAPRGIYRALAPWGPTDPQARVPEPFPDLVLGSGYAAVPIIRELKKRSRGRVFTVFLHDPRAGRTSFDVIWAPAHDGLAGPNVFTTLSSPHTISPDLIAQARANPDPRIAALSGPRMAMLLGGPSTSFKYQPDDVRELVRIAGLAAAEGYSVMVTPSRRTPADLTRLVADALSGLPADRRFVWTGAGANPFLHMIANADAIVATADSINMVGEAAATGAPVHVFMPTGRSRKARAFLDGMAAHGAVRPWAGRLDRWAYEPLDATREIAAEIARRYRLSHS